MSVTFADGRELVSARCLRSEAQLFSPSPPRAAVAALTRRYFKPLSDARTPLADFFSILLEEADLTTSEVEGSKRFVDLLGCVLRRHRESYAAGFFRNGRRPDRGRVDPVREQPFG